MQGVEIEKPKDIEKYQKIEIEQSYLNHGYELTLRLRKYNENEYILSYKARNKEYRDDLSVCNKVELPLSQKAYKRLRNKIDGKTIYKTRYIVPSADGLKVEIDIFKDFFNGVFFAEIEFEREEQANSYKIPNWLGEDISNQKRVKNGYMAIIANDIVEYLDLLIR